jgi:membrane-associated protease RseP (regulator of RpoE activity)
VLFALGLLFSIAWHELGHLTFAKLFNVRTTQYMVGFGKTIWSRQRGETEYGIKAVPLGGYIRMVGMVPPDPKTGRQRITTTSAGPMGMFRQIIEDTRAGDRAQVLTTDDGRQFYQLHPFKRIVIMFAGPFMNLVLAVILFGIVMTTIGVPTANTTVSSVSACVVPATASAGASCRAA